MKPIIKPTKKQDDAWKLLIDNVTKFILFGGGAGGGKSWLICEWELVMCYMYPGTRWFIGREELKRLRGSTLLTFFKVLKHHKIPPYDYKYNGQDNFIEFVNGSRIDLLDLSFQPRDPLYERFGSSEYTGGAIDEGGEINFKAFDVLKSRIGRCLNKEFGLIGKILTTANPKKNWLYNLFYKPWRDKVLPKGYAFIQALAIENKYLDEGYHENLDSITDKVTKERLKYGNWEYDDSEDALMTYDVILDLFSNTFVNGSTEGYITADVARFGSDKAVLIRWEGLRAVEFIVLPLSKTTDIEIKIRTWMMNHKIPRSRVIVDEDGVGGGVVDHIKCTGFRNGSRAVNHKVYQNLKTECFYKLGDMVNAGKIYIGTEKHKEAIIEELEIVKRDKLDSDGKLEIIKKDKMRDLLGRSPDFADALMMRMYPEVRPKRTLIHA